MKIFGLILHREEIQAQAEFLSQENNWATLEWS